MKTFILTIALCATTVSGQMVLVPGQDGTHVVRPMTPTEIAAAAAVRQQLQAASASAETRQQNAIGALNGDIASCGLTNLVSAATWQADIAVIRPLIQQAIFKYVNPLWLQASTATGDDKLSLLLQIQGWNLFAPVIESDAKMVQDAFKQ